MPTRPDSSSEPISTSHPPAVFAGFSSWLLDAFDYFLVTFTLTGMAREFHKSDAEMALVITMTLLCRPVGGFIFGLLADRYGRKKPLMVNMSAYALAGILTGLAPNFTALLVIRGVFGVVMGGTWGVGTKSMAMEGAPTKRRRSAERRAAGRLRGRASAGGSAVLLSAWAGVALAIYPHEPAGDSAGYLHWSCGERERGLAANKLHDSRGGSRRLGGAVS